MKGDISFQWILLLAHGTLTFGFITRIAVRLPLEGTVADPGAPWPLPQTWQQRSTLMTLDPQLFTFSSNIDSCDVIRVAFERYRRLIRLSAKGAKDGGLRTLERMDVRVESDRCGSGQYPVFGSNENYSLSITDDATVSLHAPTVWGALRGLETFSQLIYLTDDYKYQINQTYIEDFPRYSHRGLMIDTARHFYPINTIIRILDAMSWDKLNVLHWHVVDDQSFPYQSTTFPNLTTLGAYTSYHVYSQANVATILNEARLRGIRVIPEFDTPGHTWSWGRSFPYLITPCWGQNISGGPNVPNFPIHGAQEILNPMLETTYDFLKSFYEEIVKVFPDEYVHLGMDEVYKPCWESNPDIASWMEEKRFTSMSQVEQYYAERLIDIVQNLTRPTKYMIWQDPIENNVTVKADTVVEIWKDASLGPQFDAWQAYALQTASKGYTMILSGPWYLNMISYGQDWKKYYEVEPDNFTDDASLHDLMHGGEACSWSEYIDSTNILSILWPRVSAVAERLWSSKTNTDVESAKYRLDQQRCRMVRRGVPAKPILPGYCGDYEFDVPSPDGSTTVSATSVRGTLTAIALAIAATLLQL